MSLLLLPPALHAASASEDVPVQGGTAALARAVGIDPVPERARFMTELTRTIYDARDGTNAAGEVQLARLTEYLSSIDGSSGGDHTDTIPVPLSAPVWSGLLRRPLTTSTLFPILIADPRAALLSYGLAALDDETLQFLSERPALLAELYENHSSTFAAFGASLRIRNGAIVTPGGEAALDLWEEAVGEPLRRPDRFIPALFGRRNGRVAYLFDALATMEPAVRAFALGLWIDAPERRLDRFSALVDALSEFPGWAIPDLPFRRPPDDLVLMLLRVGVNPDGRPTSPSMRGFWAQVFETSDIGGDRYRQPDSRGDVPIDAAWLAEWLLAAEPRARGERLDQMAFGMRAFAGAMDGVLADVFVATAAFPRYRMLMLTLERMHVRRPEVFRAAARHAVRLTGLDARRGARALGQFQSVVAILSRLVDVRVLDAAAAEDLVASLAAVPLIDDGAYEGGVARWLQASLAPAVGFANGGFDTELIAALAGRRSDRPPAGVRQAPISWEERTYRLDLATPEIRRLTRALQRLQAIPVSVAIAVEAAADALSAPDLSVSGVQIAARVLEQTTEGLLARRDQGDVVRRSGQDLAKIATASDLRRAGRVADSLREVTDDLLADALTSIVYALSLGDPQGATLSAGNLAARHDFGFEEGIPSVRARIAWTEPSPQVRTGVPWHVRGSLLGLDLGLSALALRRTSTGALPGPPTLPSTDSDIFAKTVALLNAFDLSDADRDLIAAGIARGRGRIDAVTAGAAGFDALADEVLLDGWRRRAARWSLTNNPRGVRGLFSLAELLYLGNPQAYDRLKGWGMAAPAYDGCVCLVLTRPGRWLLGVGRSPRGSVAMHVADLNLRVAEALAGLKLPGALARGVLAAAVQDYVDRVKPRYPDDWLTLVRFAQELSDQRIQDYLAGLTANGPLVPEGS